jgi:selenide, water dikinase
MVGYETGDDAAVVRLRDDLAVVQTLDFFMPIVDDPRTFGMIAAANAISDVYAMGAEPVVALAILGLPVKKLPLSVGGEIMAGGAEICRQAGIRIAGGHSIDDTEPKFGLSVTGVVHPDRIWRNSGGRAGDVLVLTKPLGVGSMGSGIKKGVLSEEQYRAFVRTTTFLNAAPAAAARRVGVNAATDITGFGLLGHTLEMAQGAGLAAELRMADLPVLPGARELMAQGVVPGATGRNLRHVGPHLRASGVSELELKLAADPQTSGGLLLAVPEENLAALLDACVEEGTLCAAPVGRLVEGEGITLLPA